MRSLPRPGFLPVPRGLSLEFLGRGPFSGRWPLNSSSWPLPRLSWRAYVLAAYIGLNVGLVLLTPGPGPHNIDWSIWLGLRHEPMYEVRVSDVPFVYSPVAGWLMIGVTSLGYWPWFALHFAGLWLLRFSPLLVGLTLVSWGFWVDATQGNMVAFAFVAGALALRGSRVAALVSVALACLVPRPLVIPLVVWLVWTRPDIRWPALAIVLGLTGLAAGSGQLMAWIDAIAGFQHPGALRLSPTFLFGAWWFVVAIPAAAWLTRRGQVGLAGLLVTPYVLPQYFLVVMWDLIPRRTQADVGRAATFHRFIRARHHRPDTPADWRTLPPAATHGFAELAEE